MLICHEISSRELWYASHDMWIMIFINIYHVRLDNVCFIIECLGQVIGVMVASPSSPSASLHSDYAIESHLTISITNIRYATLSQFVINPLFDRSMSFVCRELLRLYQKDVIYSKFLCYVMSCHVMGCYVVGCGVM